MHRLKALPLVLCLWLVGCAGMSAAQILSTVDGVLNGACAALTFLPDEVAVCAGVKGAEGLAGILAGYYTAPTASAHLRAALSAHRTAMRADAARGPLVRIKGLPAFAPAVVAQAFNEPAENAACLAYVTAKLSERAALFAVADAGAGGEW